VEVGLVACTITVVTGSIWAKAAWGIWWSSADPRLMTVAVLWLTYLGLRGPAGQHRGSVQESSLLCGLRGAGRHQRALVHFSGQLFQEVQHRPQVTLAEEPRLVFTRWFGVAALLVLSSALVRLRYRLALQRQRAAQLEEAFTRAGI